MTQPLKKPVRPSITSSATSSAGSPEVGESVPPIGPTLSTLLKAAHYPLLLVLLAAAMAVALTQGAVELEAIRDDATLHRILFELRLPRALMAALVGAILAVSGVVYQAVLRNSLADPYVLGVPGGAALFGVLGGWLFAGSYSATLLSAFVGGVGAIALVFLLLGSRRDGDPITLLLTGVMINFLTGAAMMFALFALRPTHTQQILYVWLGSFSGVWSWQVGLLAVLLAVGLLAIGLLGRALNAVAMGGEWAHAVGFNATRVRWWLLLVVSVMVAATVSFVGMIGFVGLVIPHLARLLVPMRSSHLLATSAIVGAAFMVLADTLARQLTLVQVELPVGVVSALVGSPLFLFILLRQQRFYRGTP